MLLLVLICIMDGAMEDAAQHDPYEAAEADSGVSTCLDLYRT